MEISRRTDYALRMVVALAASDGAPQSVRIVADGQEVPYAFARSIQHDLVLAGLISSRRGAHGGMVLIKPASEITLLDVIEGMQGKASVAVCAREKNWCPREDHCAIHLVWENVDSLVNAYLDSVTIQQIVEAQQNGIDMHEFLPQADDLRVVQQACCVESPKSMGEADDEQ